ncbi:hypothetical protein EVAR_29698_1 [Eumeta japonica]|uniref:Uncharacterized protein n=1 Tax=Eumeta variegata TaxID=151549 RepID=A0A4C1W0V4_EUMVA|nr:hypothetical protein EVAR_29698_1 [Eumeta japonica]
MSLGRRAAYRVAAPAGTRVGPWSTLSSVARCGSAAGAPDQEVVRREALGLGRFDVHLRQRSGVDNVLGF